MDVSSVAINERHRYGQHYTPIPVARLLAAFAIRNPNALVLDPSCGDGRLLAAALKLKHGLTGKRRHGSLAHQIYGIDRSPQAIELAAGTGAQLAVGDFFDIEPGITLNPSVQLPEAFDAIIGNPPYIRQELMGAADKKRIEERLKLDRSCSSGMHWPRWSGRSDIYVYFFGHAAGFLKRGGRLVFLTASSWLDVAYGAPLREFLLENFRVIAVIESATESFFSGASINTAITVLAREDRPRMRNANSVRFVQLLRPLSTVLDNRIESALAFARLIERSSSSASVDTRRIRVVSQRELTSDVSRWSDAGDARNSRNGHSRPKPLTKASRQPSAGAGWGKFLRADDVFFRVLERGAARLQPLSDIARVRFGVKTGANEFFYVNDKPPNGRLRALAEVASVRRGLTTGANEFFYIPRGTDDPGLPTPNPQPRTPIVEPEFLSPVVFSLKEIRGIVLERGPVNKLFFNCSLEKEELAGTLALRYIERGERAGFHERPTCRSREPWYAAARGLKPAPLIFPSKVGERWIVAINRAGFIEDKKLYGVFPARGVSAVALAALLNSTWARYCAEITCRQMTGAQAIADIDVAVAEQIMIPDPRRLTPAMNRRLEAALLKLSRRPVYSIFEEVNCADRQRLDELTFAAMGFAAKSGRQTLRDELYSAATRLVQNRLGKSGIH